MLGTVAAPDVGQSLLDAHVLPVGAGGHVAVDQRVSEIARGGLELAGQVVGQAPLLGFDEGAGMVGDQAAHQVVGVLHVTQVAGAVEGMEAGFFHGRRVADVVQQRGGGQQVGVAAEDRGEGAGGGGDALDVCPAAGQGLGEEGAGDVFRPVAVGHAAEGNRAVPDVHGRGRAISGRLREVPARKRP